MRKAIYSLEKVAEKLEQDLKRKPTPEELAKYLDIEIEVVEDILAAKKVKESKKILSGKDKQDEDFDTLELFSEAREDSIYNNEVLYNELKESVQEALSKVLDPREKEIIIRHVMEDETLEKVGESLGITKERVRQLKVRALEKLRKSISYEKFKELMS